MKKVGINDITAPYHANVFFVTMDSIMTIAGSKLHFPLHHHMPIYSLSPWIYYYYAKFRLYVPCNDVTLPIAPYYVNLFLVTMDTVMNNVGSKYQLCNISHSSLKCQLIPYYHGYSHEL